MHSRTYSRPRPQGLCAVRMGAATEVADLERLLQHAKRATARALIRNICLGPGFFDWPEMIFNNRVTKTPLTAILLEKKTPAPSPPLHFPPRP